MNRKKYTEFKSKSYTLSMILISFGFFGCANVENPPVAIPVPPQKVESVIPKIKDVGSKLEKGFDSNKEIGNKIIESKEAIKNQGLLIGEALDSAEKIRAKTATKTQVEEVEIVNLIDQLKRVKDRNLFLELQNDQLNKLKTDQEKILYDVKKSLDDALDLLKDKENEANQLREQNNFLSKNLDIKNNESEKLKQLLQKEKEVSASAKVYRNIIWGLIAIWVALLILKNVWMSVNPAARLRF
jgi:uncharacterized phage infection (PIP) family protein YhgE